MTVAGNPSAWGTSRTFSSCGTTTDGYRRMTGTGGLVRGGQSFLRRSSFHRNGVRYFNRHQQRSREEHPIALDGPGLLQAPAEHSAQRRRPACPFGANDRERAIHPLPAEIAMRTCFGSAGKRSNEHAVVDLNQLFLDQRLPVSCRQDLKGLWPSKTRMGPVEARHWRASRDSYTDLPATAAGDTSTRSDSVDA